MLGKLIVITGLDGSGKTVQTDRLFSRLEQDGYSVEKVDFPQYGKGFFADLIARYLKGDFNPDVTELLCNSSGLEISEELKTSVPDNSKLQLKTGPEAVNPYLTSLLYAGDRWECREKLLNWLAEGKIIISNRYTCCNKAYQGAKIDDVKERKRFFDWLDKLEHAVYKIPAPDLTIFLENDLDITVDLVKKRAPREYYYPGGDSESSSSVKSEKVVDIHEEDLEYLKLVQNTYLELVPEETGWEVIKCVKDGRLDTVDEIASMVLDVVLSTIKER